MHGISPLDTANGYEKILKLTKHEDLVKDAQRFATLDEAIHEELNTERQGQLIEEHSIVTYRLAQTLAEVLQENQSA